MTRPVVESGPTASVDPKSSEKFCAATGVANKIAMALIVTATAPQRVAALITA
jgi:hypothetical protein